MPGNWWRRLAGGISISGLCESGVLEADGDVFARACDERGKDAGCGKGKGINSKEDSAFDSGFKGIGEPGFEAGKQGAGSAEGMEFIGFMVVVPFEDLAYLSFFAIEPAWRSRGYGSRALQALPEVYPSYRHLIDIEMLDENCPNNAQLDIPEFQPVYFTKDNRV